MNRETEDERNVDQRAHLARLACSEGDAVASGDLIRAAALRMERRALLARLADAQPVKTEPAKAHPARLARPSRVEAAPTQAGLPRRTLGKVDEG